MTTEHEASRTLVKSPPELWAECSDAGSLARHLGEFGEIKITRLEPETAVAWEGERASGTVRIEPSAWGTKVTITAQAAARAVIEEAEPVAVASPPPPPVEPDEREEPEEPEPAAEAPEPAAEADEPVAVADEPVVEDPAPGRRPRFGARLRTLFRSRPVAVAETAVVEQRPAQAPPAPQAEPESEQEAAPVASAGQSEPEPVSEPDPAPVADAAPAEPASQVDPEAALAAALDSLGQAHHRPFSRA
jgi:hypothetical protein